MFKFNKMVGINYLATRNKSIDIMEKLYKQIKTSLYDLDNIDIPDKDKLFNKLNTISTLELVQLVCIKILFGLTYKCQYYCMSDADKAARIAYLKTARQYDKVMNSNILFNMEVNDLYALIKTLTYEIARNELKIFFDKDRPYVIHNRVRYNLWDKIPFILSDGTHKDLASAVIPTCKLNGPIIDCDDPILQDDKSNTDDNINSHIPNENSELDIYNDLDSFPKYNGWRKYI